MAEISTRVRVNVPGAPFDGATGTVIETNEVNDPFQAAIYGGTNYAVQLDELSDELRQLAQEAREIAPDEDVRDDVIYLFDNEFEALAA